MFEYIKPSVQRMKQSFVYALWSWSRNIADFQPCVITDFLCMLGTV